MPAPFDEILLSAYMDGELRADEAEAVEERLAAEPELAAELERLRGVRRLVTGLAAPVSLSGSLADGVMARIDGEGARAQDPVEATGSNRRGAGFYVSVSLLAAAAAVCLVAVGLVIGPRLGEPAEIREDLAFLPPDRSVETAMEIGETPRSDRDESRQSLESPAVPAPAGEAAPAPPRTARPPGRLTVEAESRGQPEALPEATAGAMPGSNAMESFASDGAADALTMAPEGDDPAKAVDAELPAASPIRQYWIDVASLDENRRERFEDLLRGDRVDSGLVFQVDAEDLAEQGRWLADDAEDGSVSSYAVITEGDASSGLIAALRDAEIAVRAFPGPIASAETSLIDFLFKEGQPASMVQSEPIGGANDRFSAVRYREEYDRVITGYRLAGRARGSGFGAMGGMGMNMERIEEADETNQSSRSDARSSSPSASPPETGDQPEAVTEVRPPARQIVIFWLARPDAVEDEAPDGAGAAPPSTGGPSDR